LQRNDRDWTLQAFLSSADILGLDVAGDQATKVAMARALAELAAHPLAQLRGTRLEAKDFDALLVDDPIRDILRWMVDPSGFPKSRSSDQWNAKRCWIDGQGPCTAASPKTSARIASVESARAGGSPGAVSKGARNLARVVLPLAGGKEARRRDGCSLSQVNRSRQGLSW